MAHFLKKPNMRHWLYKCYSLKVCVQWLRVHAASLQSGHLQIGLEVFRLEVGELRRHATAAARLSHGHSNWGLHVCLRWTIRFNIFKLDKGLLVEHLQTEQSYD